jgi:hypothetical protein
VAALAETAMVKRCIGVSVSSNPEQGSAAVGVNEHVPALEVTVKRRNARKAAPARDVRSAKRAAEHVDSNTSKRSRSKGEVAVPAAASALSAKNDVGRDSGSNTLNRGKSKVKGGLAKPVRDAERDLRTGLNEMLSLLRVVSRRAGERQPAAVKLTLDRHGRTVAQMTESLQTEPLTADWNRVGANALTAVSKVESALARLGDMHTTLKQRDLVLLLESQGEAVKLLTAKKGKSQARQNASKRKAKGIRKWSQACSLARSRLRQLGISVPKLPKKGTRYHQEAKSIFVNL